jgi:hypothetical protein
MDGKGQRRTIRRVTVLFIGIVNDTLASINSDRLANRNILGLRFKDSNLCLQAAVITSYQDAESAHLPKHGPSLDGINPDRCAINNRGCLRLAEAG